MVGTRKTSGAFSGGSSRGRKCPRLRDHDPSLLLGNTTAKTLTLTDSAEGLQFRCKLPATSASADLLESIARKDLQGVSFGFSVTDDAWADDGAGNLVRTLRAVTLYDISPCSFAAYPDSKISIRSVPTELRSLLKSTRSKNDDEDDDCECDCDACEAGDCGDCDDDDCDDPNCDHGERSRHKAHMRLELAKRK